MICMPIVRSEDMSVRVTRAYTARSCEHASSLFHSVLWWCGTKSGEWPSNIDLIEVLDVESDVDLERRGNNRRKTASPKPGRFEDWR